MEAVTASFLFALTRLSAKVSLGEGIVHCKGNCMTFLWLYPALAFLIVLLGHYFIWLHLPHKFWANDHELLVDDKVVHQVRWIPFLFGAFILFMSFKLVFHSTPLWFDLSTPLAFSFSAKMIGIRLAKRRLRNDRLESIFKGWMKYDKGSVELNIMGRERSLYRDGDMLVFSLAIGKHEFVPQVQHELESVYKRVSVRSGSVCVDLGKFPKSIDDLKVSCAKLPGLQSINFRNECESVYIEY